MIDSIPDTIRTLMLLAAHARIVHHIPGRIRLRVMPSGAAIARSIDLDKLQTHFSGVLNVRVNQVVGSVVIEYNCKRLSPGLWEELVGKRGSRRVESSLETSLLALWKE